VAFDEDLIGRVDVAAQILRQIGEHGARLLR